MHIPREIPGGKLRINYLKRIPEGFSEEKSPQGFRNEILMEKIPGKHLGGNPRKKIWTKSQREIPGGILGKNL